MANALQASSAGVVVVAMCDEIDLSNADRLGALLRLAASDGASDVVVDMSQLQFMDAAGLTPLLIARKRLAEDGRRLILGSPTARVRRLFDAAGLGRLLSEDQVPSPRRSEDAPSTIEDAARTIAQLREAVESRDLIGQAKGILMARSGVCSDDAFNILRRASQHQNRKLRDVAREVVTANQACCACGTQSTNPGPSDEDVEVGG